MRSELRGLFSVGAICLAALLFAGCDRSDKQDFTRIHLANGSSSAVVYLAIEDSEMAAAQAANRLAQPLPPRAIYSAVLSRPGNYWVRTETEAGGSTIRRIEGPIRLGRGVHNWEFTREDEKPLYEASAGRATMALASTPH